MIRKIMYMGDDGSNTLYYDTVRHLPLKSGKSELLDNKGSSNNGFLAMGLAGLFTLIGFIISKLQLRLPILEQELPFMHLLGVGLSLFVAVGFIVLMEKVLYRDMKHLELASMAEFDKAIYESSLWSKFRNKKATWFKFLLFLVTQIVVVLIAILIIVAWFFPDTINGRITNLGDVGLASLGGLFPGVGLYLIWQNNISRWFLIVMKYQKGTLKWGEESLSYERELSKTKEEETDET